MQISNATFLIWKSVCVFWVKSLCADVCVFLGFFAVNDISVDPAGLFAPGARIEGGCRVFHVTPHADVSGYCVIHKEQGETVASSWFHPSVCVCAIPVIYNCNLKLVHLLMSALWICVIISVTTWPTLFLSFSFSSLACLPSVHGQFCNCQMSMLFNSPLVSSSPPLTSLPFSTGARTIAELCLWRVCRLEVCLAPLPLQSPSIIRRPLRWSPPPGPLGHYLFVEGGLPYCPVD